MESNNNKIRASVKELLGQPLFILGCYNPTRETEEWLQKWTKEHPGREQDVLDARNIIVSTQMNRIPFPRQDYDQLLMRIQRSAVYKRKSKNHNRLFYTLGAACAAAIVVLGTWLLFWNIHPETVDINPTLAEADSIQTEIELLIGEREILQVSNKATIQLKDNGTIQIEEEELASASEPAVKTDLPVTTNTNTLKVPRGRHTKIVLADGSTVWVNSETELRFPTVFDPEHRTIYADGEIYLEVAKDASRPFYVQTSEMNIRVLGTSFNVTAYAGDENQSIVLKEGLVEMNTPGGLKQQVRPNDRLVLENNRISISKVNPYHYTSWIDGVFIFEKQPLKEIAQRLSRYYRVNIVCSPEVENYKCTGKLVLFDEIDKVLQTLEEMFPIKSSIEGNTINVNINPKK